MSESNESTPLLHCLNDNTHSNYIISIAEKDPSDYESISSDFEYSSSLSLEELLLYKEDPWWHNLRCTAFCSFWLIWMLTLIAAILLAYLHKESCCPDIASSEDDNVVNTLSQIAVTARLSS